MNILFFCLVFCTFTKQAQNHVHIIKGDSGKKYRIETELETGNGRIEPGSDYSDDSEEFGTDYGNDVKWTEKHVWTERTPPPYQKACALTEWSAWSQCSASCGECRVARNRACVDKGSDKESCANLDCNGEFDSEKTHKLEECCVWDNWGSWSSNSQTCGKANRHRNRSCKCGNIPTSFIERCGSETSTDTQAVNMEECCVWDNWGSWSSPSHTCGKSTKQRNRSCKCGTSISNSPSKCGGGETTDSAQESLELCCSWTFWGEWSSVPQTCGKTKRNRNRSCKCGSISSSSTDRCGGGSSADHQAVIMDECCAWTNWGDWSSLSVTCGSGVVSKTRQCAAIGSNTNVCRYGSCGAGRREEIKDEILGECCMWSNWEEWSSLSETCGSGTVTRTRKCFVDNGFRESNCKVGSCGTGNKEENRDENLSACTVAPYMEGVGGTGVEEENVPAPYDAPDPYTYEQPKAYGRRKRS